MLMIKPRKNRKGFTLIELIVVVAIIAILAAVAVPSFIGMQKKAEDGVVIANASAIAGAINVYNALGNGTITNSPPTAADQTTLTTAGLWPGGMKNAAAEAAALLKVKIDATTKVATVIQ